MFTTDIVIGLEVHAELATKTKLFSSCPRIGSEQPNTRVDPVTLGHPGSRPVLNAKALEYGIKLCLALECNIAPSLVFSRKSYFYPDMSKNFQITQYEEPLGSAGNVPITGKKIALKRIHLEEDPAALSYPGSMHSSQYVLIDYNRAGNPLLEIVTEPVITSPAEAREFLNQLILVLQYLGIFDETCVIKADANVSLKENDYTRVEIKNISGFKELERALNYEITRQRTYLKRNLPIKQETRGWDETSKTTKSLRTKESEDDYGYIYEPDIPVVAIKEETVQKLKANLPELAHQKAARYTREFSIDPIDAQVMASDKDLAALFETVLKNVDPKLAARWLRRELLRVLNYNKKTITSMEITPEHLIPLFQLVEKKSISDNTAQELMEKLMESPFDVTAYVKEHNLAQVNDENEILKAVKEAIDKNHQAVDDFHNGEQKALQYLVGQVMRLTKGKANPQQTQRLLKEQLSP